MYLRLLKTEAKTLNSVLHHIHGHIIHKVKLTMIMYTLCLSVMFTDFTAASFSKRCYTEEKTYISPGKMFGFFCPCWRNEHSLFQQLRMYCCNLKAGSGHFCSCLKSTLCHDVTSQVTTRQRTAKVSSGFSSPVTRKYSHDILDWITSRDNVKWNQYKVEWTVLSL